LVITLRRSTKMADTTFWRIEITSFGHPVREIDLENAIATIPGVKTIDIEEG